VTLIGSAWLVISGSAQLQTPKTEASRRVLHLPEALVHLFEMHLAKSEFKDSSDFIFHRSDGSPLNQNQVREGVWYKALEKVGVNREKGTHGFHILRHSAGSIIHARTGNLKLTQKALGHAKVSTTSDIYVHLEEEAFKVATELMAGEIFGNCDLPVTESSRMVS
jgi:integrase